MSHAVNINGRSKRRLGLASLELVVFLPVMLFMLALMVNFGVMGVWRIRGEVTARDAVWRARWPRTGGDESRPPKWPPSATFGVDRQVQEIEALSQPAIEKPVVRGPLPSGFLVRETLDPRSGMQRGWANITREQALMKSLPPFESGDIDHPLLEETWRNAWMGIPRIFRRTRLLYVFPQTDQGLVAAFVRVATQLMAPSHRQGFNVMDRNEDTRVFYGRYFNFYPRVRHPYPRGVLVDGRFCEIDPEKVYLRWLKGQLLDQINPRGDVDLGAISRLPRGMHRFFTRMYRAIEAEIERLEQSLATASPTQRAAIQARINELRALNPGVKLGQLELWDAATLRRLEDELKQQFLQSQN